MTIQLKPLSEVNHQAIRLLSEKLWVADTFRFVTSSRLVTETTQKSVTHCLAT